MSPKLYVTGIGAFSFVSSTPGLDGTVRRAAVATKRIKHSSSAQ
jgi:hypothetical protein